MNCTLTTAPDVVVIGAGAAGLMAAITAAEHGASVQVHDSQYKIGAKILVSGGGRCNITNQYIDVSRFHGETKAGISRVLRSFGLDRTLRFFAKNGVDVKLEETGKYFPVSDSSRTVLHALLEAARSAGAALHVGSPITGIGRGDNGQWQVDTPQGSLAARSLVVCTGGLALPKSGSNGAGYQYARAFGHRIVPTTPALTPLLGGAPADHELSGIALPVRLSLRNGEKPLAQYTGSFLFTHTGYSGPAALNLSRHVARERWVYPHAEVFLSYLPQVEANQEGLFWQDLVRRNSRKGIANTLSEFMPRRVAEMVCRRAALDGQAAVGKLAPASQVKLRDLLFRTRLEVTDVAGYTKAEATAGGVSLEEIDPTTMMSRLASGLFLAGEVLDVDGWLGGYNFQWAWSSGFVAGRAAARYALASPRAC